MDKYTVPDENKALTSRITKKRSINGDDDDHLGDAKVSDMNKKPAHKPGEDQVHSV